MGAYELPHDSNDLACDFLPFLSVGGNVLIFMSIISLAAAFSFAVWTIVNRTVKLVKVAQPTLCVVLALSAAVVSFSTFFALGRPMGWKCITGTITQNLGESMAIGAITVKLWRVQMVLQSVGPRPMVAMRDLGVYRVLGMVVAIDAVFLITWMIVAPVLTVSDFEAVLVSGEEILVEHTGCKSRMQTLMNVALNAYHAFLAVFGCAISLNSRSVDMAYMETQPMVMSIYLITLVLG
ncbi:unnamed protein product, partial [Discosporangium mesarthrocarpum]